MSLTQVRIGRWDGGIHNFFSDHGKINAEWEILFEDEKMILRK
tara:strand:- start:250 stop:378 length:129 start_codon:yes stop_codon:yes gene_type:complete